MPGLLHFVRNDGKGGKSTSFKQIQLILGEVQILRNFVLVIGDEAFYIPLNQFDGCGSACLAIIAQRAVLSVGKLERDGVVLVVATPFFLVLSHNPLI